MVVDSSSFPTFSPHVFCLSTAMLNFFWIILKQFNFPNFVNLREKFSTGPGLESGSPALHTDVNPGPGENFSLKLPT